VVQHATATDGSNLMNEYYVSITKTTKFDYSISQGYTFDDIVSTHVNNRKREHITPV